MAGGGSRNATADLGELRVIWLTDSHNITTSTQVRDSGVTGALAEANSWRADAIIHTGDVGDNEPENVAAAFALLRGTAISCPLITVVGNHDEYEATPGTPNTSTLEGASYFNRPAPFYHTGTLQPSNGALLVRWLTVDNNFYDVQASDPSVVNAAHSVGDRVGHSTSEPVGGSYRRFGTTQLNWIASTLAADTTSHMVLMLLHYPPATLNPTDRALFCDRLQADGRPTLILCGHVHPDAMTYSAQTTDQRRTYVAYKAPACQESGAYVKLRARVGGRNSHHPTVAELTVKNFSNPGGWVINSPFVQG